VEWLLLEGVPEVDRRHVLSIARRRRFEKGEAVFHEGDPGDTLHLIATGRFAVRVVTSAGDTAMLAPSVGETISGSWPSSARPGAAPASSRSIGPRRCRSGRATSTTFGTRIRTSTPRSLERWPNR
jgi:CRP-like cAMP-binding protein